MQFGLQFEEVTEGEGRQAPANVGDKPAKKKRATPPAAAAPPAKLEAKPEAKPAAVAEAAPESEKPGNPAGGGEVVRLDRFRKKK